MSGGRKNHTLTHIITKKPTISNRLSKQQQKNRKSDFFCFISIVNNAYILSLNFIIATLCCFVVSTLPVIIAVFADIFCTLTVLICRRIPWGYSAFLSFGVEIWTHICSSFRNIFFKSFGLWEYPDNLA